MHILHIMKHDLTIFKRNCNVIQNDILHVGALNLLLFAPYVTYTTHINSTLWIKIDDLDKLKMRNEIWKEKVSVKEMKRKNA